MAVAGDADPVAVEQMLAATLGEPTQVQATLAVIRAVAAGTQNRITAGITAAALSAMNAASGPDGQGGLAANAVAAALTKPPHAERPAIIRRCRVDECNKLDVGGGKCTGHGGGRRCQVEGCTKGDRGGGRCISHGGGKRCERYGCDNGAASGGKFCVTHGGGLRCIEEGCERVRKVRGKCAVHGGINKKKLCVIAGCSRQDLGGGLCKTHGGVRVCSHEGCDKRAKARGACMQHDANEKICSQPGCTNPARTRGKCKDHSSGVVKTCSEEPCAAKAAKGR